MEVNERIKFFRTLHGWTQEELAEKLGMSPNGYGSIERGDTDVNISRLKQLAQVFAVDLSELLGLHKTYIFNPVGNHNNLSQNLYSNTSNEQLQNILEKQQIIIEQQAKEIELLKQQNLDLREMINLLKK